ncbi:MAG: YegP family protein [Flavobacteriales bacterium]|nr:YegP family protein [Flavobacteriales bacterium]
MFEIFKSEKSGEYYFRLKAKNGEPILASQGYSSKSACENGVNSVQSNADDDDRYEVKEAADGRKFFNLKAKNGQVIAKSQMYKSDSGLKNGISSVKKNALEGKVKDLTE